MPSQYRRTQNYQLPGQDAECGCCEDDLLVEAAQAGACRKALAAEYGISRRSIERLSSAESKAAMQ
jgi:hypothetical protein